MGLQAFCHFAAGFIIVVENGSVMFGLPLENTTLHGNIGFHIAVPDQMVFRDVETGCYIRMEPVNGFTLVGADLCHGDIVFSGFSGFRRDGIADIAAHMGRTARCLEDFSHEGRRGRFPIGPCNCHQAAGKDTCTQFQFTDDFNALLQSLLHKASCPGNTRADYHHVNFVKKALRSHTEGDLTAGRPEGGNMVRIELILGLYIADNHPGSFFEQHIRCTESASGHSDHKHTFILPVIHFFSPPAPPGAFFTALRPERSCRAWPSSPDRSSQSSPHAVRRAQNDDG